LGVLAFSFALPMTRLAVLTGALGYVEGAHLSRELGGIARVSQIQLLQTILSLSVAALLLSENISPWMWLTALIVIGSIFVSRRAVIRKV
jgi:drug/metabolite transporter (DMT)-like permease